MNSVLEPFFLREENDFAEYVINSRDLQYITLKTFKVVRSAILYFVLAVKVNEDSKENKKNNQLVVAQRTPISDV